MLSVYDNLLLSFYDKLKVKKFKKEYELYRTWSSHNKAEKIRAKYGYSGGVDGNQYIPLSFKCRCRCC